jgi:transglutaminase-like putative cysteine protease
VVEDEDTLLHAVSKMLRMKGFSVIEAIDGDTALGLFRANHRDIAAVLLDMTLPGISGPRVFGELRRIRPGVKVILTTAYNRETAIKAIGGQHTWGFIRKPYQLNDLVRLLRGACLDEREVRDYAAPSFAPERPLIEVLRDLTSRIYRDFTYRSGSTTVSTQVNDVVTAREGVCQDFARLVIACLRANGLAASYVSGYLATDPPPGKERMIGIDATHAWASVWTPQNHWLGLDPTNDQMVDERYIIAAWGRDYADVPPLRGIIYTDSKSSVIDVAVDVAPFEGGVLHA